MLTWIHERRGVGEVHQQLVAVGSDSPDGIEIIVPGHLGKDGVAAPPVAAPERGGERLTVDSGGSFEPEQFQEGGQAVHVAHQCVARMTRRQ